MLSFKEQEAVDKSRNSVGQCPESIRNSGIEVEIEATSMIPISVYK